MTKEQAIELIKEYKVAKVEFPNNLQEQALEMAIKALDQQKPMEKFENAKDHIRKLAGDYKCYDNRLTDEEALELCHILEQQPSDDCVRVLNMVMKYTYGMLTAEKVGLQHFIKSMLDDLPPVTPPHGTCKDCKHNYKTSRNTFECSNGHRFYMREPSTFYCADFEKRGSEMIRCLNLACGFMYYCSNRENKPNFIPPCKKKLEKRGGEDGSN